MSVEKIENENLFEELIDGMMAESNHNPQDYCFRYSVNEYPKATHDAFDFPGEYVENLKVEVFTENGRNLKMDSAQLVMPDGDITCKSTINVEHQTYPVSKKIDTIYDYKLYLIHKTNIPSNSIIMTNNDIGRDIIYCESHDQIFKLHVNTVMDEDITKRLTILKNIKENKKILPEKEAMYFSYISIFVKEEHSKQTMEELSQIFSQINNIEAKLELDIHQILKKMIKYHFKDDKNKCKELLTMISKSIFQRNLKGLTYKERTEIRMEELNQKLEEKNLTIEEKNLTIEEKNLTIEEKNKEIEKLKQQLKNQKK